MHCGRLILRSIKVTRAARVLYRYHPLLVLLSQDLAPPFVLACGTNSLHQQCEAGMGVELFNGDQHMPQARNILEHNKLQ
ncbi:hypothetical protein HOY82DRAFT_553890 [Tuber indicum]|nr:hypothetical protein HOY82DRAFT_553890 [Tuber indicum]